MKPYNDETKDLWNSAFRLVAQAMDLLHTAHEDACIKYGEDELLKEHYEYMKEFNKARESDVFYKRAYSELSDERFAEMREEFLHYNDMEDSLERDGTL